MPGLPLAVLYSKFVFEREVTCPCIGLHGQEELEKFIETCYSQNNIWMLGIGRELTLIFNMVTFVYMCIYGCVYMYLYVFICMHICVQWSTNLCLHMHEEFRREPQISSTF